MILTTHRMLVELDALFDTRIGTLGAMSPQDALRMLAGEDYAYRLTDEFPGFDMEDYTKRYRQRNTETLKSSLVTPVLGVMADFIRRVINTSIGNPSGAEAEIHLNVYPYQLPEKDLDEIAVVLKARIPYPFEIKFVNVALENVNPFFIHKTYKAVVLYHFNEWLEKHIENKDFVTYPCFGVTVFAPALLRAGVRVGADVKLIESLVTIMKALQPMIGLMYLPVETFCSTHATKRPPPTSAPEDAGGDEDEEEIKVPEF